MGIIDSVKNKSIYFRIAEMEDSIESNLIDLKEEIKRKKPDLKSLALCYGKNKKKIQEAYNESVAVIIENKLREIKEKYVRVDEKYKYVPEKRLQIVIDFSNFIGESMSALYAIDLMDCSLEVEDLKKAHEEQRESIIRIEEIEKRFNKLLGK